MTEKKITLRIPEVECKDEAEQQRIFEKLKGEGYKVRVLNL
jgi:hypothetical protein